MKIMDLLIDTNIVLDWILRRQPFHKNSVEVISLCMCDKVRGYLAAHTILNVFYITRKDFDVAERRDLSRLLCNKFEIIGIDRGIMLEALNIFGFHDLEDSLQIQCAIKERLDFIITRDTKGFKDSKIRALLPEELLAIAQV